jgi:hypothetical protein
MAPILNSIKLVAWFRISGAHSQKHKAFVGPSLPLNKESRWIMYSAVNVSLKFTLLRHVSAIKVNFMEMIPLPPRK